MNQQLIKGSRNDNPEKQLKLVNLRRPTENERRHFWKENVKTVQLDTEDFLLFSDWKSFRLRKRYKLPIMVYVSAGEDHHKFFKGIPALEFIKVGNNEEFTYIITDRGKVGYVMPVGDDEIQGPKIPGNSPMSEESKDKILLDENDFIIFAGKRLRKGDYCFSLKPSLLGIGLGKIKQITGGGRMQEVDSVLIPTEEGAQIVPPKKFEVSDVRTFKGIQYITTTDGRKGYNIIQYGDTGYL